LKKFFSFLFENLLQLTYFVAFEAALFWGLQFLLFNEPITQDTKDPTIVPRWVSVIYFVLIYIATIIAALLVLSNLVPSKRKSQIMRWFWWALALILPFLIILINE
jgi:hypothetical protein